MLGLLANQLYCALGLAYFSGPKDEESLYLVQVCYVFSGPKAYALSGCGLSYLAL